MTGKGYRTTPEETERMPRGIPYIIGNEVAERFSYYGMRAILVVFMTEYLMSADGDLAVMDEETAKGWYHLFGAAVYMLPILGAILSDALLGKFRTIILLSLVYCGGHLALALDETRVGLTVGLALIAVGSGGIKPCVSANVGDQFGHKNRHLVSVVFSWFYFSVNFGSFFSTLMTPYMLRNYGPSVAFGIPGALMLLATWIFWLGRERYVHIPAYGMDYIREVFGKEGLRSIGRLAVLILFLAPYYALFEQSGSAWILQAKHMDLHFLGMELLPSQTHAFNPILVMILAPAFAYGLYPLASRFVKVTPLRKIGVGLALVGASFLVSAWIEVMIGAGGRPSIWYQFFAYVVLTSGEVMVGITALEFFYTQAPLKMKSTVMSVKMFAATVGNVLAAAVNFFIRRDDGSSILEGAAYYLFFVGLMAVTVVFFVVVASRFKERTYLQGGDAPPEDAPAAP